MAFNISLRCQCGAVRGVFSNLSKCNSKRIACLCNDCQTFAHFLGKPNEILDQNGGTDIVAVAPANIKITQGFEFIKGVRLSPKGMFRWYAGCCKTPIANCPPSRGLPFHGVIHSCMAHSEDGQTREQALGPMYARILGKYGIGPLPPGTPQTMSFKGLWGVLLFLVPSLLLRKQKPSPFFDTETGQPLVEPYILKREERESLRALCGPRP